MTTARFYDNKQPRIRSSSCISTFSKFIHVNGLECRKSLLWKLKFWPGKSCEISLYLFIFFKMFHSINYPKLLLLNESIGLVTTSLFSVVWSFCMTMICYCYQHERVTNKSLVLHSIGLATKFTWVFLLTSYSKPKQTFWPTQCFGTYYLAWERWFLSKRNSSIWIFKA